VDDYLPLLVTFVLAVGFVLLSIVTARLLGPQRPTAAKAAPYESGIVPTREPPDRFPVRFYLVAMIFIVFDIEIIFLFPWAVVYRELGAYALGVMGVFLVPFVLSFAWEVSQGGLDWGPVKRYRRFAVVDAARTSETTVRRVGLEGREWSGHRSDSSNPEPDAGEVRV
jgi:NADH-quinone oxidoreductase subunit A